MANTKITSRVIADDAVTTAAIADDAVTSAKLDTNIDIAGTFDVTGATTLDSTLTVAGRTDIRGGATPLGVYRTLALATDTQSEIVLGSQDLSNNYVDAVKIRGLLKANKTDGELSFYTLSSSTLTERMRIDTSGNLMVGKTATGLGNAGVELDPSGQLKGTAANVVVQYLNRTGSDGTIAEFRKDNTTVGGIGTVAGRLGIGTGDAGLFFDDDNNKIGPVTMASGTPVDSNGLLDLGYSGARFKDLYLSGGALTSTVKFLANTSVSGSDATIFRPADNTMAFSTNGAERFRIDANGKIFMNEGVPLAWTDGSLNVSADIYGDSSDNLVFRNTSAKTERMRILSTGSVSISNDGSVPHSNSKFHVKGTALTMSDSAGNAGGGFQTFSGTKAITGTTAVTIFNLARNNGAHTGIVMITKSDSGDSAAGIFSFSANYGQTPSLTQMNISSAGYSGFTLSATTSNTTTTFKLAHGNAGTTKNYTYTVLYGGNVNVGTPTLY